jgi:anti-sigma B factor antagonist
MVTLETNKNESYTELCINGEVDAASSIELDETLSALIAQKPSRIIVNCSELTYISSAGLGVFMSHIQDLKNLGIRMVLFGMDEKVRNVFSILGLDQLIDISASKEQALS